MSSAAARAFNTAGPCEPGRHYMLPAAERLPEAAPLVAAGGYFVVHAPRQTGKTTTLIDLAKKLTAGGHYAAVHFSCEVAEAAQDDYTAAQLALIDQIRYAASQALPEELRPPETAPTAPGLTLLAHALRAWSGACPRPIVLFFDEIDALRGESLRAVLRQLRDGFRFRPAGFPWSVMLCGLRDVRDYKVASGGAEPRLGSPSPFNIKVESLRLGDFTPEEVRTLYRQHTTHTAQGFSAKALARVSDLTAGQPWLVNAIAREVIEKMGVLPPTRITSKHIDAAKERLILARATHLDSLAARLLEPRVRQVLAPILAGTLVPGDVYDDDIQYLRDIGLVAARGLVSIANPIYKEIVLRILTDAAQRTVALDRRPAFVTKRGRLDVGTLLTEFAGFWGQHGDALTPEMPYPEIAPQLVFMGYLQRVVNGGGFVEREVGVGRGRIDLCVVWPYTTRRGKPARQRAAFELKVWRAKKSDPAREGLAQLDRYLESLGLGAGVLIVFDARPKAKSAARRTRLLTARTPTGRPVRLLRA